MFTGALTPAAVGNRGMGATPGSVGSVGNRGRGGGGGVTQSQLLPVVAASAAALTATLMASGGKTGGEFRSWRMDRGGGERAGRAGKHRHHHSHGKRQQDRR